MRIDCPSCGERDASEFTYLGDAKPVRPDSEPDNPPLDNDSAASQSLRDRFHDYVYLRDNIAGFMTEYWYHASGCRSWLVVERNTATHEIKAVKPAPGAGAAAKPATGKGRR